MLRISNTQLISGALHYLYALAALKNQRPYALIIHIEQESDEIRPLFSAQTTKLDRVIYLHFAAKSLIVTLYRRPESYQRCAPMISDVFVRN